MALIGAGMSAGGGLASTAGSLANNWMSRKWSEDMYERQFADQVDFWNMQNVYNSPVQQMARLKEAGLNPRLIYGQSSGGASGTAGLMRPPSPTKPEFQNFDLGGALTRSAPWLSQMYDLEIKAAQKSNIEADTAVKLEDALLRSSQAGHSAYDLGLKEELRDVSVEYQRQILQQIKQDIEMQINENERKEIQNALSVQEAGERILSMRIQRAKTEEERQNIIAQRDNIRKDGILKQLDIELKEQGIQPTDDMLARIVARALAPYYEKGSGYDWRRFLNTIFPPAVKRQNRSW